MSSTWIAGNNRFGDRDRPAAKRERAFDLALPAQLTGIDAGGRRVEESTRVVSISAQEVSARVAAPLAVGSRVVLALEIPRTLILEKPLRLCVSGTVAGVRDPAADEAERTVTIELDKAFKLAPAAVPAPA